MCLWVGIDFYLYLLSNSKINLSGKIDIGSLT